MQTAIHNNRKSQAKQMIFTNDHKQWVAMQWILDVFVFRISEGVHAVSSVYWCIWNCYRFHYQDGLNEGVPMQLPVCPEQQQLIQKEQLMEISQPEPSQAATIPSIPSDPLRMEALNIQVQALHVANTKDWQKSITHDHRSFLLQKLLKTQSSAPNPSDRRIQNLIMHIKRVESRMFEVANSKSEYYQLWVKRIERLRRGLEERTIRHENRCHQAENQVC